MAAEEAARDIAFMLGEQPAQDKYDDEEDLANEKRPTWVFSIRLHNRFHELSFLVCLRTSRLLMTSRFPPTTRSAMKVSVVHVVVVSRMLLSACTMVKAPVVPVAVLTSCLRILLRWLIRLGRTRCRSHKMWSQLPALLVRCLRCEGMIACGKI